VGKFTTGVVKSTTTVVKPVVITEKPAKGISQVCFTANIPQFNEKLAMGNKKWIVVSNGRDSRRKPLSDGERAVQGEKAGGGEADRMVGSGEAVGFGTRGRAPLQCSLLIAHWSDVAFRL
jgi:hypothetical protein